MSLKNTSLQLQGLLDPTFAYSNYNQTTYTITDGIFKNYHLLSVSIDAQRLATMSSIFLIFPICLLCSALCLVFSQEPANNARLSVPLGCITSCLAFSYVVSNQCPPVSYTTRLHLMIFFTYTAAIITMVLNYYLWAIEFAKKELGRLNGDKKTLLMDAHWMPRKINPPATKVIVLPDGIHKPPAKEPAKEPAKDSNSDSKDEGTVKSEGKDTPVDGWSEAPLQSRAPAGTMAIAASSPKSAWEHNDGKAEKPALDGHDMPPHLPGTVDTPSLHTYEKTPRNNTPLASLASQGKPTAQEVLFEVKEREEPASKPEHKVSRLPYL
jgi:hypothetical protein